MTRRNAITILVLSLVGFAASVYLTNLHYQIFTGSVEEFGFCGISREISCETVTASPYSKLFGVPLAWLGAMLYMFWIALASSALYKPKKNSDITTGLFLLTSATAVALNIYLGQLMFFTIGSLCLLCLLTYIINLAVLVLALNSSKGSAALFVNSAIKTVLPFSGQTRYGFVMIVTLIAVVGTIGQVKMQQGIKAASQFNEAGFRQFQKNFSRLKVDSSSDPFVGAADAELTIVEFSNFECPHCRKAHFILQTILPGYQDRVKLVYKNLPFKSNPSARALARLGEAALKQDRFWPLHDLIFDRQKEFGKTALTRDELMQLARDAGLDMARLEKDFDDPASDSAVQADVNAANRLGIDGTPVFLLNGLLLKGLPKPAIFRQVIELELERAKALNHSS
ncbi:MAG: thioredoxin domain-containing protein [Mariprofundaceae bacterium]